MSTFGKILFWFFVLAVIGVAADTLRPREPNAPAQPAQAPSGPSYSPAVVRMAVKQLLRDPDSAKFGSMRVYGDRRLGGKPVTVVCGSVNAKNAFGGYPGAKDFVFVSETLAVAIDNDGDNTAFVKVWNSLCAGRHPAR